MFKAFGAKKLKKRKADDGGKLQSGPKRFKLYLEDSHLEMTDTARGTTEVSAFVSFTLRLSVAVAVGMAFATSNHSPISGQMVLSALYNQEHKINDVSSRPHQASPREQQS